MQDQRFDTGAVTPGDSYGYDRYGNGSEVRISRMNASAGAMDKFELRSAVDFQGDPESDQRPFDRLTLTTGREATGSQKTVTVALEQFRTSVVVKEAGGERPGTLADVVEATNFWNENGRKLMQEKSEFTEDKFDGVRQTLDRIADAMSKKSPVVGSGTSGSMSR